MPEIIIIIELFATLSDDTKNIEEGRLRSDSESVGVASDSARVSNYK